MFSTVTGGRNPKYISLLKLYHICSCLYIHSVLQTPLKKTSALIAEKGISFSNAVSTEAKTCICEQYEQVGIYCMYPIRKSKGLGKEVNVCNLVMVWIELSYSIKWKLFFPRCNIRVSGLVDVF